MSDIIILNDKDAIARRAAESWAEIASSSVEERGSFAVALAGGSTPKALYALLAEEPYRSGMPWEQTFIFFGDERRVPADDPQSNYRMVKETLLDHIDIPAANIFPMAGMTLAKDAMKKYRYALEDHFNLGRKEWPRFDLTLLGMGADGHFASVFPGTRAVSDITNMAVVYEVPSLGVERITLTVPVFNHARNIIFMITGENKAEMLAETLSGEGKSSTYPIRRLKPVNGNLVFMIDENAASHLPAR